MSIYAGIGDVLNSMMMLGFAPGSGTAVSRPSSSANYLNPLLKNIGVALEMSRPTNINRQPSAVEFQSLTAQLRQMRNPTDVGATESDTTYANQIGASDRKKPNISGPYAGRQRTLQGGDGGSMLTTIGNINPNLLGMATLLGG